MYGLHIKCYGKQMSLKLTSKWRTAHTEVQRTQKYKKFTRNWTIADRSHSASYKSHSGKYYSSKNWRNWLGTLYICCIFEMQTMQPFIVPEMTCKGHSRLSAVSSFVRSPSLSTRDRKSRLHTLTSESRNTWITWIRGYVERMYLFQCSIAEILRKVASLLPYTTFQWNLTRTVEPKTIFNNDGRPPSWICFNNFHIWSRDCHRVRNLLLCTKFHQNRMIFKMAAICTPSWILGIWSLC